MTLGLIFNHCFHKTHFGAFSVFHAKYMVILEDKKISNSKMVHPRKISTPEVRGNESFFYCKTFFIFDFGHFLEK